MLLFKKVDTLFLFSTNQLGIILKGQGHAIWFG